MSLASLDCGSLQAWRNPVFSIVKAFLHDSGADCHLTTSFTFLKTALMLRFPAQTGPI